MKSIPDCVWRYWGIIKIMEDNPGLYGMDRQREDAHNEICQYYKVRKEDTLDITNNLDKYGWQWQDPSIFHKAMLELSERKRKEEV